MASPEEPLTAIQRFYLQAFDAHLKAEFPADHTEARLDMNRRLPWLFAEHGLELPDRAGRRGPRYRRTR